MKKKYSDVEIGELFKMHEWSNLVYLKIEHETDHNYFYICYQGDRRSRGRMFSPLPDGDIVYSVPE